MKGEETKDIQATMEETVGGVTGDDDDLLETRAGARDGRGSLDDRGERAHRPSS